MHQTLRALYYVTNRSFTAPQGVSAEWHVTQGMIDLTPAYSAKQGTIKNSYWNASPNGKAHFHQSPALLPDAQPGQFFYLNFEPLGEGEDVPKELVFYVDRISQSAGGYDLIKKGVVYQETVSLMSYGRVMGSQNTFEVSIDNKSAHGFFKFGVPYVLSVSPFEEE